MANDEPPPIAVAKHQRVAGRPKHWLTVSDIGECVVPGVQRNIAVHLHVLFSEGNSGIRTTASEDRRRMLGSPYVPVFKRFTSLAP